MAVSGLEGRGQVGWGPGRAGGAPKWGFSPRPWVWLSGLARGEVGGWGGQFRGLLRALGRAAPWWAAWLRLGPSGASCSWGVCDNPCASITSLLGGSL